MQPVSPVIPGRNLPETIIAEHQDEYGNLPAIHAENGIIVTRWHLSFWERLKMLVSGDVYLWVWTFGQPIQPMSMQVEKPSIMAEGTSADKPILA